MGENTVLSKKEEKRFLELGREVFLLRFTIIVTPFSVAPVSSPAFFGAEGSAATVFVVTIICNSQ